VWGFPIQMRGDLNACDSGIERDLYDIEVEQTLENRALGRQVLFLHTWFMMTRCRIRAQRHRALRD